MPGKIYRGRNPGTAGLERIGLGYTEIEIPDLPQKISEVEAEIRKILDTDPYQYKYLLEDSNAVADKKKELEDQIQELLDYAKRLDELIAALLASGVKIIWQMK